MIYATAPLSNLSVINGTTNREVASLEVGDYGSDYVAVNPTTDLVYTGNLIVNGLNNKIIGHFPDNITDLAVDPRTNEIFAVSPDFSSAGNTTLLIYNGTTDLLITRILLNASADTIAINPTTHIVYIAVCSRGNVCAPIYLLALNETTSSIESKILVDSSESSGIPFAIAVDSQTNMIYLTDQRLVSINGTTDTVTAETTVSAYTIQCRGVDCK